MARVKRGNVARKRRNKILRLARGFQGSNGSLFRTANQRVMKALCNAYRDRRRRKRDFRRLWIARINAAARLNGTWLRHHQQQQQQQALAQWGSGIPHCLPLLTRE